MNTNIHEGEDSRYSAIRKIETAHGVLEYRFNWDCDGMIQMLNARTIQRYWELRDESAHIDMLSLGIFFAFNKSQFDEGYKELIDRGFIKDGDKVFRMPGGGYGTKEGIDKLLDMYDDINRRRREECDPQEVYFYEHANHESQIGWEGDTEAIKIVIDLWGADVARKIKRHNVEYSIDHILNEE